jgi:hypothetical protein
VGEGTHSEIGSSYSSKNGRCFDQRPSHLFTLASLSPHITTTNCTHPTLSPIPTSCNYTCFDRSVEARARRDKGLQVFLRRSARHRNHIPTNKAPLIIILRLRLALSRKHQQYHPTRTFLTTTQICSLLFSIRWQRRQSLLSPPKRRVRPRPSRS